MMKLKPCPFCGSEDLRRDKPNSFIPEYIHCEDCGGTNGAVSWSTRATDPLMKEMAAALVATDKFADEYHWAIHSSLRRKIKQALQKYQEQVSE